MENRALLTSSRVLSTSQQRASKWVVFLTFFALLYGILALINQLPHPLIPLLVAVRWTLSCLPLFLHHPIDWFTPPIYDLIISLKHLPRIAGWLVGGEVDVNLPFTPADVRLKLLENLLLIQIPALVIYLYAFYHRRNVEWVRKKVQRLKWSLPEQWSPRRLTIVFCLILPIALLSYIYIIKTTQASSIWSLIQLWKNKGKILEGKFYPFTLFTLFGVVNLMVIAYGWHRKTAHFYQWLAFLGLVAYTLAVAALGPRGFAVHVWMVALGLYHFLVRRVSVSQMALLLAGIFLFSWFIFQLRWASWQGQIEEGSLPAFMISEETVAQLTRHDLGTRGWDNQIIALYVFPDHLPLLWGRSWFNLIFFPIPRRLWPGKPNVTPGALVRDQFFGGGAGLPLGYLGDLYANFHLPGIFLGYWLLGFYHRFLYEWVRKNPRNISNVFFYLLILTFLYDLTPLGIVQGSIYCIPTFFLMRFVGRKA